MSADATLALMAAVNTAVAADTALAALGITIVYDHVPDHLTDDTQPNFEPYCSFGAFFKLPWNTLGRTGSETMVQIDTWSRERGSVKAALIMSAMRDCLERADLVLNGAQLVGVWYEDGSSFKEDDGVTVHGWQRFRFVTHQ